MKQKLLATIALLATAGTAHAAGGDGSKLKSKRPLDWYMVSDHAEYLGVSPRMADRSSPLSELDIAKRVTSEDQIVAFKAYSDVLNDRSAGKPDPDLNDPEIGRTIWREVVATAEKHYQPGSFTTFAGFEWTPFRGSEKVPALPFSAIDSDRPEDLSQWMDERRSKGAELLAIAHNGNASNGLMFPEATSYGGGKVDLPLAIQVRAWSSPIWYTH